MFVPVYNEVSEFSADIQQSKINLGYSSEP